MHLVELSAGCAALTLSVMGYGRPLLNDGRAQPSAGIVKLLKLKKPSEITLVDSGPWARTWCPLTADKHSCLRVAEILERSKLLDADEVWEKSRELVQSEDCDDQTFAASYLMYLAGVKKTGTVFKGKFVPKFDTLVTRVKKAARVDWPLVRVIRGSSVGVAPIGDFCFIHAQGFDQDDLVSTAQRWDEAGAMVAIMGYPNLIDGWNDVKLPKHHLMVNDRISL